MRSRRAVRRTRSFRNPNDSVRSARYLDSSVGSQCSFATEVTMVGGASVVSDEDLQELDEFELQQVYTLTGQTGSCMYMAPEVFRGERWCRCGCVQVLIVLVLVVLVVLTGGFADGCWRAGVLVLYHSMAVPAEAADGM